MQCMYASPRKLTKCTELFSLYGRLRSGYKTLHCWNSHTNDTHGLIIMENLSIGSFSPSWEWHEGATHTSQLEFCLVFSLIVIQATPAENLWPPRSKSAHSQVSAAFFYVWTMTFVLAWICMDDTQASRQLLASFSPASKRSAILSQSRHWSGGRRVCQTCSAAPDIDGHGATNHV